MSLSDPLTLLREFTTAKRKVVIDGEHIVFGKTRFAKDAPTAYKSSTGEFYPVSWLLCLAQQEEPVNAGLYVKATTAAGVKPVAFLDRKKVLDYLHGRAEVGAPTIDFAAAPKVEPVSKEDVPMEEVPAEEAASAAEREEAAEAERAAAKAALLELLKQPIEPKAPAAAAAGAEAAADAAADVEMEEAGGEAGGEAGAEDAAAAAPAEASDAASDAASESGDGGGGGGKKKKKEAQVKGARIMGAAKAFIRHEAHKTKAIVKREQRMRSRKSVLLAPHAPSFPRVHEVLSNFRKKNKEAEDARKRKPRSSGAGAPPPPPGSASARAPPPSSSSSKATPRGSSSSSSKEGGPAVLVVPAALTAVVNMWNVKELLTEHSYTPPTEKKAAGQPKEALIRVKHTFDDGSQVTLHVMDNPTKQLGDTDGRKWGSVCAVIAQGNAWQFKGWPKGYADETELFARGAAQGFHVRFRDDMRNQTVKNWNIEELTLSKEQSKRHEVNVMMMSFWNTLHAFLASKKPGLLKKGH